MTGGGPVRLSGLGLTAKIAENVTIFGSSIWPPWGTGRSVRLWTGVEVVERLANPPREKWRPDSSKALELIESAI